MDQKTANHPIIKTVFFLFLCLFFLFCPIDRFNVHADIAPPEPPVGSDISPGSETTNVRMISEYVWLDIQDSSTYWAGQANVTAIFTMRNLGSEAEYMRVRFPLHHEPYAILEPGFSESCGVIVEGPSISDFKVWVNKDPVPVDISYEPIYDHYASSIEQEDIYRTIPCWGHFNVHFPPAQFIVIKVSYQTTGYDIHGGGSIFEYVIGTGAGWNGTIGSADIVFRLPYEVNNLNFERCQPDDCEISSREVRWHYEDFEPDGVIELTTIKPYIWQSVLTETQRIENNPQDGEAWGRLGRAYKSSLIKVKGIIALYTDRDHELFRLSQESYQKAVELLPTDADWRYGYADLICTLAEWSFGNIEYLKSCTELLKDCLDIDPQHEQGNEILDRIVWLQSNSNMGILSDIVDVSGSSPDFLILTPGNYPTGISTLLVTETVLTTSTRTLLQERSSTQDESTSTQLLPEETPIPIITKTETPQQISNDIHTTPDDGSFYDEIILGIVLTLIVFVILSVYRRKNRS